MVEVQPAAPIEEKPEPAAPALPDYVLSPNAVFNDVGAKWRYGRPPDYSKTRKVWEEGRKNNHPAGSLEQIVENLVKNWEVEASFKPQLSDWRTVDPERYTFAMSGGPPQSADNMLKVGTYNAIIAPNEYYDPTNSDFASSHKTFKRMMPTFAWEVIEVYSGPPKVVFKWRHWGQMKNDYVGFNNKGQTVTAKAHGGPIEIFGTTVAVVDDALRVVSLDTYMDSLDMFRQIAPHGVVNSEPMDHKVPLSDALEADAPKNDGMKIAETYAQAGEGETQGAKRSGEFTGEHVSKLTGEAADAYVPNEGAAPAMSGACPFMGSAAMMNGAEAPHPLPSRPESEDAMSVGPSTASADTEFSDSVLVDRKDSLPGVPATETVSKAADAQQGAPTPMDLDTQTALNQPAAPGPTSPSKRRAEEDGEEHLPASIYSSAVTGDMSAPLKTARRSSYVDESTATGTRDGVDAYLEQPADTVHPHPKAMEAAVQPAAGEAVIASADAEETREAKREMSAVEVGGVEEAAVMNRE